MLHGNTGTDAALKALGEILEAEGECFAVAVVGGSALNLLGIMDRATRDVAKVWDPQCRNRWPA
jgi:hypothetical protein